MKKFMIMGALLFSAVIFAQKVAPKHEIENGLVKSTYFHDNGQISQTGFYKDGKVHGQWTSFDTAGSKISFGNFTEGIKTGKWFFWTNKNLNEVDYSNSRVASIKTWKEDAVATRN